MAREYFCAYHSYLDAMEQLNDAARGRLFTACLLYSMTGKVQELHGDERFVFPSLRSQIDRDSEKYQVKCDQNRDNVLRRYTDVDERIPKATKATKEKEKEKTKAKEIPPTGGVGGFVPFDTGDSDVDAVCNDWIQYKAERTEHPTPMERRNFTEAVKSNLKTNGKTYVIECIRLSMGSGYKGVVWKAESKPAANFNQRSYDRDKYDREGVIQIGEDIKEKYKDINVVDFGGDSA